MKPPRSSLAFVLFMAAAAASAQIAAPPPAQTDPFVGTWVEKPGKEGSSYVRTIETDGEDLVFFSREGHSKRSEHNYRIRCDGFFHDVPFGSMSCKYTAPNIVEGESRQKDGPIFWKREVSADGQKMMISSYKDGTRTKLSHGSGDVLYRVK